MDLNKEIKQLEDNVNLAILNYSKAVIKNTELLSLLEKLNKDLKDKNNKIEDLEFKVKILTQNTKKAINLLKSVSVYNYHQIDNCSYSSTKSNIDSSETFIDIKEQSSKVNTYPDISLNIDTIE